MIICSQYGKASMIYNCSEGVFGQGSVFNFIQGYWWEKERMSVYK